jgi:hypothetical protein
MTTLSRLDTDTTAPLPLHYAAAISRALWLRQAYNWSYPVIATVMEEYHGFKRTSSWWKLELVGHGAPLRPRGVPFRRAS